MIKKLDPLKYLETQPFSNMKEISLESWINMLHSFKNFPEYLYHDLDKIKGILGFNLTKIKDSGWHLWPIALDLKTGLYKIKAENIPPMEGFASILENNFIFFINGEIYQYCQKTTRPLLAEMAIDLRFQITRLAIVAHMDS